MTGIFRFAALLCISLSFICCAKDTAVNPVVSDTTGFVSDSFPENKVDRAFLLRLVNGLRSRGCNCGDSKMPPVPSVSWNGTLEKAAWLHSKDMSEQSYFDHIAPGGSDPGQRLDAVGYPWLRYGENIATGLTDEQATVLGWLTSPKHCRNMMDPNFTEMGVGRYGKLWTMELGTRK
ncbi:CAP domain-containing protein [uncultured Chitinophaga sp.]|jgi:Uncharacterized protein with SCP/PR1 domains|uniref:CAP domain-containing protein n=1 Tax=uncultured Chitinophaga sp. TaxID=339340 RepID=UPI002611E9BC|nr:CAP domain-containing protein [uncultured Chitinophaga sp.]